ncbi:MAG: rhodanese-like domain-containing protein [Bacteroidetes bacterium]|nr:rhodanese-like domain-containing protein [Bacteroidota bacterium]
MSKVYIIFASLLILVAFGLVLLPDTEHEDQIPPEALLKEIMNQSRFLSADLIAARIIDEDPSIMLVDVRTAEAYNSYSLPGAINIPLKETLDEEWQPYLNQRGVDVVFFSNGDLFADQAWILCSRLGYKNLYVMEGGLNQWFTQIMQPTVPPDTSPNEDFDLYSFRKAASIYFGGGAPAQSTQDIKGENIQIIRREKKTATAGGC